MYRATRLAVGAISIALATVLMASCGALGHPAHSVSGRRGPQTAAACKGRQATARSTAQDITGEWQVSWGTNPFSCRVSVADKSGSVRRSIATALPVQSAQIAFPDRTDGWIMVNMGPQGYPASVTSVFRSVDAGRTWKAVLPAASWKARWGTGGFVGVDISPIDGETVWILASMLPGAGSAPKELLQTNDGGHAWNLVATPQELPSAAGTDQPVYIDFTSINVGWLAASSETTPLSGPLFHTDDGGKTWTPVSLPATAGTSAAIGQQVDQLLFRDALVGMVVVSYTSSSTTSTVCYSTSNGGVAWTQSACNSQ